MLDMRNCKPIVIVKSLIYCARLLGVCMWERERRSVGGGGGWLCICWARVQRWGMMATKSEHSVWPDTIRGIFALLCMKAV